MDLTIWGSRVSGNLLGVSIPTNVIFNNLLSWIIMELQACLSWACPHHDWGALWLETSPLDHCWPYSNATSNISPLGIVCAILWTIVSIGSRNKDSWESSLEILKKKMFVTVQPFLRSSKSSSSDLPTFNEWWWGSTAEKEGFQKRGHTCVISA